MLYGVFAIQGRGVALRDQCAVGIQTVNKGRRLSQRQNRIHLPEQRDFQPILPPGDAGAADRLACVSRLCGNVCCFMAIFLQVNDAEV